MRDRIINILASFVLLLIWYGLARACAWAFGYGTTDHWLLFLVAGTLAAHLPGGRSRSGGGSHD